MITKVVFNLENQKILDSNSSPNFILEKERYFGIWSRFHRSKSTRSNTNKRNVFQVKLHLLTGKADTKRRRETCSFPLGNILRRFIETKIKHFPFYGHCVARWLFVLLVICTCLRPCFIVEPETLLKAISKVDDMDYHILDNNCEHFAVWCKTGRMKSFQVRTVQ